MNGTDHTGKQGRGGEFAKQVTNWQTPNAKAAEDSQTHRSGVRANELLLTSQAQQWQTPATDSFRSRGGDRKDEMGLDQQMRFWPTPNAAAHSANTNREERGAGGPNLHEISHQWPTPTTWEQAENPGSFEARRQREAAKGRNGNGMGAPLDMVASSWPTPNVPNGGRTSNSTDTRENGSKRQVDLGALVTTWGTPTSRDWKDGSSADCAAPTNGLLGRQVIRNWESSPQGQEPSTSGGESSPDIQNSLQRSQRKRLNVLFTLWLMGLPLHWLAPVPTVSGCAATQSYLYAARKRLRSLLGESVDE